LPSGHQEPDFIPPFSSKRGVVNWLSSWLPPQPPVRRLQQSAGDWVTAAVLATGFLVVLRYVTTAKKTPVVE
ncbi:MAG: hypothetical protein Q8P51_10820, partial [Ignavibacteria bacterium]|nr:hypothetical protein [Ignavibacteria bacterium]